MTAGYDVGGQLIRWNGSEANGTPRLNEQLGYSYDAASNLKQRTNNTLVQNFTLDNANTLIGISRTGTLTVSGNTAVPASSVTVNGQPAVAYADFTFASSNGLTLNDGPNNITNIAKNYYGTVSATNTFTANLPASVTLQYDANGNLTNDGLKTFGYDEENQLTNVTLTGQWREDFLYDGMGRRRITREYAWQGAGWTVTNETRYVYSGNSVIQEWDSNNVAQVSYTHGINGVLARTDTNGSIYYHADGNGNVTALLDSNQYVVGRYLYDPFGRQLGKWGTMAEVNKYRFASKEFDDRAGLYYFGRRFYDPGLQRWLNRDPIQESGGINLYAACGNDFVDRNDPLGLDYWNQIQINHNYPKQYETFFANLAGGGINVHAQENLMGLPAWAHSGSGIGLHDQGYNDAWYNFFYDSNGNAIQGRSVADAKAYLNKLANSETYKPYFDIGTPVNVNYRGYGRVQSYIGGVANFGRVVGAIGIVGAAISIPSDAETIYGDIIIYKQDLQQGTPDGDAWAYADLLNLRATLNQDAPLAGDVAMRGFLAQQNQSCPTSNGSFIQSLLNLFK